MSSSPLFVDQSSSFCAMKHQLFDAVKIGQYDDVHDILQSWSSSFLLTSSSEKTHNRRTNYYSRHHRRLSNIASSNSTDTTIGVDGRNYDLVNCTDSCSMTPLHIACTYNYTDIVRLLVQEYNAMVHLKDDLLQTPLHIASSEGHTHVVRLLLLHHVRQRSITTISNGNNPREREILQTNMNRNCHHDSGNNANIDINAVDLYGNTALLYAARSGFHEIVSLLLSHSSDTIQVNCINQWDHGNTPFIYACQNRHIDVIQHLLLFSNTNNNLRSKKRHLNFTWKNQSLHTGLFYTLTNYRPDNIDAQILNMVMEYVKQKVSQREESKTEDIDSPIDLFNLAVDGNTGNTPLHIACSNNDSFIATSLVMLLLNHSCDATNGHDSGSSEPDSTPKRHALLIDVNQMNYNGDAPLRLAIQCGHLCIVQMLLKHRSLHLDQKMIQLAKDYRFCNPNCYRIYQSLSHEYEIRCRMQLYHYLLQEWVPNIPCIQPSDTSSSTSCGSNLSDVENSLQCCDSVKSIETTVTSESQIVQGNVSWLGPFIPRWLSWFGTNNAQHNFSDSIICRRSMPDVNACFAHYGMFVLGGSIPVVAIMMTSKLWRKY
jgi:ankyrin repeat protein